MMRFIVDECTGPAVARWLSNAGYDTLSVYDQHSGISDEDVIHLAVRQNRILITNDKDFGEKVYRDQSPHCGVILLRLEDERSPNKIAVVQRLLQHHAEKLPDQFVVVTERQVRFSSS